MKKITLIEYQSHHEVLDQLIEIFTMLEFNIKVITHPQCSRYSKFQNDPNLDWHIVDLKKIHEINTLIDAHEYVLFITLVRESYDLIRILSKHKIFAIAHNANDFLKVPQAKINRSSISGILHNERKKFKWLKERIDHILFPQQSILNFISNYESCTNFNYLPLYLYQRKNVSEGHTRLRLTIPGGVDYSRRDYELVTKTLLNIIQSHHDIELVLLGKILSKESLRRVHQFKKQIPKNLNLIVFEDTASPKDFHKVLSTTDFLILPLFEKVLVKNRYEIKSKTCISGGINDMIRYGIPGIIPEFYSLPNKVNVLVEKYKDESEFQRLLSDWINHNRFKINRNNFKLEADSFNEEILNHYRAIFL